MAPEDVNIDFDAIKEIADKGVRRAVVFLGIGFNAAKDSSLTKYELTDVTQLQLVPPDVNSETLAKFKDEFGIWIVACGLRELIETFAVYLDAIHNACLFMAFHKQKVPGTEAEKFRKTFPYEGLEDKMKHLGERFSVRCERPDLLLSINQARHCLTHRRGIVGQEDCGTSAQLQVKWIGMEVFIETPSGEIIPFQAGSKQDIYLSDGGTVKLRFPERSESFQRGSYLKLSHGALAEICYFVHNSTVEILASAIQYTKSISIPFKEKEQPHK
jgi:hypothetical protein